MKTIILHVENIDKITLESLIREGYTQFITPQTIEENGAILYLKKKDGLYLKGILVGKFKEVKDHKDVERLLNEDPGLFYVVKFYNIKALAAEDILANIKNGKIIPYAENVDEIELYFNVLEKGFENVVIDYEKIKNIPQKRFVSNTPIEYATVKDIIWIGKGERVCIDFVSSLYQGEGCLIGSFSRQMYLVGPEITSTNFSPARPFRVNAGAVHSYCLLPNGKTKYLSDLKAGDSVAVCDTKGNIRSETVGRIKREFRPLILIKTEGKESEGSIVLQNAESVYLYNKRKERLHINELKIGDEILTAYFHPARHTGIAIDEAILEI
ncbi:MAG: 3-dehydroquinate synthase II [Thermoplasmata archaeon]